MWNGMWDDGLKNQREKKNMNLDRNRFTASKTQNPKHKHANKASVLTTTTSPEVKRKKEEGRRKKKEKGGEDGRKEGEARG